MDTSSLKGTIKKYSDFARERLMRAASTERDRRALIIGGSGLLLMILYLVFHSFATSADKLELQANQLDSELNEMIELRSEYRGSEQRIKQLAGELKTLNEPLISTVEKIIVEENIERKNFSIRDVNIRTADADEYFDEKSVDVELKNVSLNDLVDILYNIQRQSSSLKVSNLIINTRLGRSESINAKFRISTYELKQVS